MSYAYKLKRMTELEPISIQHIHAPMLLAFQFILVFFLFFDFFRVGLLHPDFMFYLFCSTFPLQLSSAAHLYVPNSFISLLSFNLLQMRPCFTLSYLHLQFNLHYSPSQLSHAYLIITHASLFTTIYHVYVAIVCS